MVKQELRENLPEDSIVFDNPSFDNSIIGTTFEGRPIYVFEDMVQEFIVDNELENEEDAEFQAIEFIEYNTMRALPYINSSKKPLILYNNDMEVE